MKPIVIMGPTAAGKTEVSLEIALKIKGEIISADSRQVYKYLSHGLAKPEGIWKKNFYTVNSVNYHLVDFLEPTETYDTAQFVKDAEKLSSEITERGNAPIFTGGTGLYIQSFFIGLDKLPQKDDKLRLELTKELEKKGNEFFHKRLREIDPVSAEKIPAANTQRLIRALEVYKLCGRPISSFHTKEYNNLPKEKAFFVFLNWSKTLLLKRIKLRTETMFDDMVEETKELLAKGYSAKCNALKSLGYSQILDFIDGKITKSEAIEKIISLTKAYAKRQMTWFKRYKNIYEINIDDMKKWDTESLADNIITLWKKYYL